MNKLFISLLLLLVSASIIFGQQVPIVLGTTVTGASVIINPKNTDNIVVGTPQHKVYTTTDGGKGWKSITVGEGKAGLPIMTVDKKGEFYFYSEGQEFPGYLSSNGGTEWKHMSNIGDFGKEKTTSQVIYNPVTNTHYANWTQANDNCETNIFFSMSGNGKKWSPPLRINGTSGDCEENGAPVKGAMTAVSPDGKLFLAWTRGESLFLDRSYDKGKTWLSNDMLITRRVNNGLPVFICDYSNLLSYSFLFLSWTDYNGTWFMRSSNFGDNWATPIQINPTDTYSTASWMVIDEKTGKLYIAYGIENEGIYLAYSVDGGNTFTAKKAVESAPDNFLHLDVYGGRIALVWGGETTAKQPALLAFVSSHAAIFGEEKVEGKKKGKKNK